MASMPKIQISQARDLPGERYLPDDLDWYTGPEFGDRQEMMPTLFGRSDLPYGAATAYLFRRFGYPERGWDPYKELISWTLTTPDPEIRLRITPYVGADLSIAVRPLLSVGLKRALDLWEGAPRAAWEDRFEAHLAGLPRRSWFSEVEGISARFGLPDRPLMRGLLLLSERRGELSPEIDAARSEARLILTEFQTTDPFPGLRLRPGRPEAFDKDDPLRAIASKLAVTARDLMRGVSVRDQAINLFGPTEEAELSEHPVSGFPSGALGNASPKGMAELHARILRLGAGDPELGISRVLDLLGPEVQSLEPS
jgi:hypothetical protein